MKLYVFAPQFHLRPKNTDWVYNHTLPQLKKFNPAVEIYLQQSIERSLVYNGRVASEILKNRLGMPIPNAWLPESESAFSKADVKSSGADLIYGHSPTNIYHLPVMCHTGPIFEEELRSRGVSEALIEREKRQKQRTIQRSQLVTLHSQTAADTLIELAGERAHRIRVLPFFLPHLRPVDLDHTGRKFQVDGTIKLLFVGREAKRKGLEIVMSMFQRLDAKMPGKLHLEIVSSFADGAIALPSMPNLVVSGELSRDRVQEKLKAAHMLLMPSRFETFGWVYLEAMASGTIALASDQPTQKEILVGGQAGLLVKPDAVNIAEKLESLFRNRGAMQRLALAGLERVKQVYDPYAVAKQFEERSREAIEIFSKDRPNK